MEAHDATQPGEKRSRLKQACRKGSPVLASEQRQFLPGALEVQDSPPSPAGRWLLWVLLALFALSVGWATWGGVDIVVTAPGRIVPSGQVKVVQALETSAVASIHIVEGQRVEVGDALLTLDATVAEADDIQVSEQLRDKGRELAWRLELEHWFATGRHAVAVKLPADVGDAEGGERAAAILRQKRVEISAGLLSLEKELEANESARQSAQAELERLRATLAVVRERVAAYETLVANQYGARVQYLEMLERQTDMEKSIPVLQAREAQLHTEAQSLAARLQSAESEARAGNLLVIERLSSERNVLQQESRKAGQRRVRQVIRSPATGTVEELAVHTLGAVVTPAQALMKIVPEDVVFEVEALLQNKDIGFVHEGQVAAIKLDAFNFTKYGLIDAQVSNISNDSVEDERQGWVFRTRLALAQEEILVEGKSVKLSPGMSVTAEIKTGQRRLIEFFLSPLLRYRQESVRER